MDLREYRREFSAYNKSLQLARYQSAPGPELDRALYALSEQASELFSRDATGALSAALAGTPVALETEQAALRALSAAARNGFVWLQARALSLEVARCEASVKIQWDGSTVSVTNIDGSIASESSASRRAELRARFLDALAGCDELRVARENSFRESARLLGAASCLELYTEATGVDSRRLATAAERILERTGEAYSSAFRRAQAREAPGSLSAIPFEDDFLYLRREWQYYRLFTANSLAATYSTAMHNIGVPTEKQPNIRIEYVDGVADGRALGCFPVSPPEDVRLVAPSSGGSEGYAFLFRESGLAQHFGWVSRDLAARYPEFVYSPDGATRQSYGLLFEALVRDPEWLVEQRGGLRQSDAAGAARELALLSLHDLRQTCEGALHEATVDGASPALQKSGGDSSALRRESAAARAEDAVGQFSSLTRLRAMAFEVCLREHLRTRHGRRWWSSGRAGDELIDLWNTASRYTVEELSRLIGMGDLSFDLLSETISASVAGE